MVFPDSTALWLFPLAAPALLAIPRAAVLYIVVQSAEQGGRVGLASVVAGSILGHSSTSWPRLSVCRP